MEKTLYQRLSELENEKALNEKALIMIFNARERFLFKGTVSTLLDVLNGSFFLDHVIIDEVDYNNGDVTFSKDLIISPF